MIGFVIGTLCLFGLVRVLRGGRCGHGGWHHHHHHGHHGWGRGGWGGRGGFDDAPPWERGRYDDGEHDGPFWARGGMLHALFRRLDTSPGQEKVIREAVDELRKTGKQVRDDARQAREQVAKSFRSDSWDEVALGEAIHRVDGAVEAIRKAGLDALAKVHAALDERQRNILADLIARGPRGFGGPYRQAF